MQFGGYNTQYCENLLEMYAGSMEKISKIRWEFVLGTNPKLVLDYGCGNNAFSLFSPDGVVMDSFDIGTIGNAPYPQSGIRHERYDLICFWDVLEHVDWKLAPDTKILEWLTKTDHVAGTVPILPKNGKLDGWKHHKPGEHLTYFTQEEMILFMKQQGFMLMDHGMPECPPRKDIHSFLFGRSK